MVTVRRLLHASMAKAVASLYLVRCRISDFASIRSRKYPEAIMIGTAIRRTIAIFHATACASTIPPSTEAMTVKIVPNATPERHARSPESLEKDELSS